MATWYGKLNIAAIALSGDKQLARKLMRLHRVAEDKLAKHSLVSAAKPMIKAIRQNIGGKRMTKKRRAEFAARGMPGSVTGNLRRSIGYRLRQYKRTGVIILVLGPRWPLGAHGHLVEFGTAPRYTSDGKFVGKMPAMPFMRNAWDANIAQCRKIIQEVQRIGILREAGK